MKLHIQLNLSIWDLNNKWRTLKSRLRCCRSRIGFVQWKSSTVNIITSTIKNALSIPIQALTSRPENYKDQKKDNNDEKNWEESDESVSFKKVKPVDVVFVLKDNFEGNKAEDNQKYALVKEISGISEKDYYEVKSGLLEGEMIVIGGYRALSKELSHGDLVMLKIRTSIKLMIREAVSR